MRFVQMWMLVAAIALGGCGGSEEGDMDVQQRAEERAVQTRAFVDDLVERLGGTGVEVTEDSFDPCDLAVEDSGVLHTYTLRFSVGPDAADRLGGEIADALAADGWTVRADPPNPDRGEVSVRFLRDSFSIGSKIATKTGAATAGGSGGCVS